MAVLDNAGQLQSEQRYMPFGAERPIDGGITQTDFGFTGQRALAGSGADGLLANGVMVNVRQWNFSPFALSGWRKPC